MVLLVVLVAKLKIVAMLVAMPVVSQGKSTARLVILAIWLLSTLLALPMGAAHTYDQVGHRTNTTTTTTNTTTTMGLGFVWV